MVTFFRIVRGVGRVILWVALVVVVLVAAYWLFAVATGSVAVATAGLFKRLPAVAIVEESGAEMSTATATPAETTAADVTPPDVLEEDTNTPSGRPDPWMATNGQKCDWGVPGGTVLSGETSAYIFTNCTSFNLKPGKELDFNWSYDQADFDFLMGQEAADGMAWWGPLSGSLVTVSYDGETTCTGRSFEILPGISISGSVVNAGQDTMATWSQGNWGKAISKLFPPECRAPVSQ